jgi:hypothetical protein
MHNFILPECYADTTLIEVLGYKKTNHQSGVNNVLKIIKEKYSNKKSIGFIDKDKRNGDREYKLYLTIKSEFNGSLLLKQKPNSQNYLIEHPNMEMWLNSMADSLNVDKSKFGVNDLLTNKDKYKKQSILKDVHFRNFINALSQKPKSPLQTVKNWIDELNK